MNRWEKLFESKAFGWVLLAIGGLILLLVAFRLGEEVGFRRAGFSYQWGENYYRNFSGPRPGLPMELGNGGFLSGHGTAGFIVHLASSSLVVQDKGDPRQDGDDIQKTILVTSSTRIREFRKDIALSDLKTNDFVVVLGAPDAAGQIEAKFIRVMPEPPTGPPPGATLAPVASSTSPK